MTTIAVAASHPDHKKQAIKLAQQLQLPIVDSDHHRWDYLLVYTAHHLELRSCKQKLNPIFIDFFTESLHSRSLNAGVHKELIAKACGLKGKVKPRILDCTAGLGRDAFMLATLGCEVVMLERSPIIAALLADALQRFYANESQHVLLTFKAVNSFDYLNTLIPEQFPDVIYMDPMFPERKKSALVKKEMRILKDIVGTDEDIADLFNLALQRCHKRVVVKRPKLAQAIGNTKPNVVYSGKQIRFDVYLR